MRRLTEEKARKSGRIGGVVHAAKFANAIEGEMLNHAQIARRLGIAPSTLRKRIAKAGHPLTWEKLR